MYRFLDPRSTSFAFAIVSAALLGSPAHAQAGQVVASDTFAANQYELWRTDEGIRWVEARDACASGGATLVSLTSASENEVVATLIDTAIASGFRCVDPSLSGQVNTWIGLFEQGGVEGAWTWVSGEPFVFTNWGPGEPNNSGGSEDFGMIFCPETGKRGQWNDAASLNPEAPPSRQYVCERPADSDGDGVTDDLDVCDDTLIPEATVPSRRLGVNRWALVNADSVFDTNLPNGGGQGPDVSFTIEDTAGCSCEQIAAHLDLGEGHLKFGCSISAMEAWVALVNP